MTCTRDHDRVVHPHAYKDGWTGTVWPRGVLTPRRAYGLNSMLVEPDTVFRVQAMNLCSEVGFRFAPHLRRGAALGVLTAFGMLPRRGHHPAVRPAECFLLFKCIGRKSHRPSLS